MSGTFDKAKGKVKEATGKATGNEKLEAEGKIDQGKGKVKNAADSATEKASEGFNKTTDAASDDRPNP